MKDTKMTLSTIFRVCVIVAAVSIIIAFASCVSAALDDGDLFDSGIVEKFGVSTKFYFLSLAATIGAVVLSILGTKYSKKVSVIVRTFFLGVVAGLYFAGVKLNYALSLCASAVDEAGGDIARRVDTLVDEGGLSESQAEFLVDFIGSDFDPTAYLVAMMLGCVVLGILTFTSIHWFAKKKDAE